jgi:hypothetical protein
MLRSIVVRRLYFVLIFPVMREGGTAPQTWNNHRRKIYYRDLDGFFE